ncbi:hypothetical protein AB9F29_21230 [Falsihalocynthiibacter sp. S25ZX9]|uniref:hypothetical protein n=1 Tax=Falsihalocynthiibacter sp. S25ZX9 TaxID=3240870 RepID=UPI003510A44E
MKLQRENVCRELKLKLETDGRRYTLCVGTAFALPDQGAEVCFEALLIRFSAAAKVSFPPLPLTDTNDP